MKRKEILETATKMVCGERQDDYGSVEDNFETIAKLWNIYLNGKKGIKAEDVGIMMALLKIARISSGKNKEDNYIDLAGYAACAGEIAAKSRELTYEACTVTCGDDYEETQVRSIANF